MEKWRLFQCSGGSQLWEMLDGNVGKAEELDKDEIQKILNKHY